MQGPNSYLSTNPYLTRICVHAHRMAAVTLDIMSTFRQEKGTVKEKKNDRTYTFAEGLES